MHELAHFWSTDTTLNFGYSMNWSRTCYGTNIMDYTTVGERMKILHDTLDTIEQNTKGIVVGKYITVPSFEHIEHLTNYHLCRQLRPNWVNYFRNEAKYVLKEYGKSLLIQDNMLDHSPLYRSSTSIYLAWKYRRHNSVCE
jgi:hypothetical protein